MQIANFTTDITPPIGSPLVGGLCPPVTSIEHPLLAKGVIIKDDNATIVICALDYAALCNQAYSQMKQAIADALKIHPDNVAVQSLHQHTAPAPDIDTQQIIDALNDPSMPDCMDIEHFTLICNELAQAVKVASSKMQLLTHVKHSSQTVAQVASNRRIIESDGILRPRYSATTNEVEINAPEGLIDADMRSVTFYQEQKPLISIHFYATHPQSFYNDGRVTYDTFGIARERLETEMHYPQIIFNGCGGNIAMGKYNRGTLDDRNRLTENIFTAMKDSLQNSGTLQPVKSLVWKNIKFKLAPRSEIEFSDKYNRNIMLDRTNSPTMRIEAAMKLAFNQRLRDKIPFELSCLELADLIILTMPGEMFIEYQLWAQQCATGKFICTAAYGDCAPWYICTNNAVAEGGIEPPWSFSQPDEAYIKKQLTNILISFGN